MTLSINELIALYQAGIIRIVDVHAYLSEFYGIEVIKGLI